MKKLILLPLLLLTSCQSPETPKAPKEPPKATFRISTADDPKTLDPRLARRLSDVTFLKLFYEGLMRQESNGEPVFALADNVTVSNDRRTYTFTLKEAYWSNGDKITAKDFENSWKSLLNPNFLAPNAYQFFYIKGAKSAKEGLISLNEVGITAPDDQTLVVELEEPTPYFLELVSTYPYFPLHSSALQEVSNNVISSGPYVLKKWDVKQELHATKNPLYYDKEAVKLDEVIAYVLEDATALKLFEKGELDWVGSPLSTLPTDSLATLKEKGQLQISSAAATQFFSFNTEAFPLNSTKLRKALSLALNREEIISHVTQGNQMAATGLVPPSYGLQSTPYFNDFSTVEAKGYFEDALVELGLNLETFPQITLDFASDERNNKIAQAVKEQWKIVLGIDVNLNNSESKLYFDKLSRKDFQIAIASWFGDYHDPIAFLEIFKSKSNGTNTSGWENASFSDLLKLSTRAANAKNRSNILRRAERILVNDMPIAPLFHASFNYMKKESVQGVYLSDLGFLDLKHAEI